MEGASFVDMGPGGKRCGAAGPGGRSPTEAKAWLDDLAKAGRYQRDGY